jgi:hypothetical protein
MKVNWISRKARWAAWKKLQAAREADKINDKGIGNWNFLRLSEMSKNKNTRAHSSRV